MVVESCQLLSNALGGPYEKTHWNHPCAIWVRESRGNAKWLIAHTNALLDEYRYRSGGKTHKCEGLIPQFQYAVELCDFPNEEQTPFANCAANEKLDISYKHIDNVHLAYQLYLNDRWDLQKREPQWGYYNYVKKETHK